MLVVCLALKNWLASPTSTSLESFEAEALDEGGEAVLGIGGEGKPEHSVCTFESVTRQGGGGADIGIGGEGKLKYSSCTFESVLLQLKL
jgi:hypothetical protein